MTQVEYVSVQEITPSGDNPRYIKEEEFLDLKHSIRENPEYFEARPILVNSNTGEIFAGNMRYRAAVDLGMEQVPVVFMDLTKEKQRELMIRDNVNQGKWDWDVLANEWNLEELSDWGLKVNDEPEDKVKRTNFMVVCSSLEERDKVKEMLGIVTKKISYEEFLEKWKNR